MARWGFRCAVVLVVAVVASSGVSAPSSAGGCTLAISPNPPWRGATVTITGTGFAPNQTYQLNFNGAQISTGQVSQDATVQVQYVIPNTTPTDEQSNIFLYDASALCERTLYFNVLASAPTTTTQATTPTTQATTTSSTSPSTTSTSSTTTSTSPTTTTSPETTTSLEETTTTEDETTTTTLVAGATTGVNWLVWVVAALALGVAVLAGVLAGRRMRPAPAAGGPAAGDEPAPPPPAASD